MGDACPDWGVKNHVLSQEQALHNLVGTQSPPLHKHGCTVVAFSSDVKGITQGKTVKTI